MQARRALAVLGTVALTTAVAPSVAQAAETATPTISHLGYVAKYSVSRHTAKVNVDYKCTNKTGQVHYIGLTETQSGRAYYIRGWRNDAGGVRPAKCTGATVHETVTLLKGLNNDGAPRARTGAGTLEVGLLPKSTAERGGWNVSTGAEVFKKRQVRVDFVK